MAEHVTTDPLCRLHVPPRGWWRQRRFDRARGRICRACDQAREAAISAAP